MQRMDVLHLAAREMLRWIHGGPAMTGPDLTRRMCWTRETEGERPLLIPQLPPLPAAIHISLISLGTFGRNLGFAIPHPLHEIPSAGGATRLAATSVPSLRWRVSARVDAVRRVH